MVQNGLGYAKMLYLHVQYVGVWFPADLHHIQTLKGFKGKIKPPRLNGLKWGALATRTPHRPNPIGLSLCKIVKVEDGCILLGGADIVDGSPVLDIKPYVPFCEALPSGIAPSWVSVCDPTAVSYHSMCFAHEVPVETENLSNLSSVVSDPYGIMFACSTSAKGMWFHVELDPFSRGSQRRICQSMAACVQDDVNEEPLKIAQVHVSEVASQDLSTCWKTLPQRQKSLIDSFEQLNIFVREVLSFDFRSAHQRCLQLQALHENKKDAMGQYHVRVLGLDLQYSIVGGQVVLESARCAPVL